VVEKVPAVSVRRKAGGSRADRVELKVFLSRSTAERFKEFVLRKYGRLSRVLSAEVESALVFYMEEFGGRRRCASEDLGWGALRPVSAEGGGSAEGGEKDSGAGGEAGVSEEEALRRAEVCLRRVVERCLEDGREYFFPFEFSSVYFALYGESAVWEGSDVLDCAVRHGFVKYSREGRREVCRLGDVRRDIVEDVRRGLEERGVLRRAGQLQ